MDPGACEFGDQIPEAGLGDFGGGIGSADIAFDAVAFAPGTYNGRRPNGDTTVDPTAPQQARVEPDEDVTDGLFSAAGSSSTDTATTDTASTALMHGVAASRPDKSPIDNGTDRIVPRADPRQHLRHGVEVVSQ
ncbi:hypothetical protein SSP531S_20170 [Streptomyces spongiicola]|uniref:Uncharacterized protein n=1 Tax=Streptomyces spongiicola TaxID=1690221 RepID=A0A388SVK3_9ACTN|nr:hypothetical protein [Streptomyces spongiicola]GBQ00599.1 hypothetical protein SSP531S_20170 [Streptomyces spongiicola]